MIPEMTLMTETATEAHSSHFAQRVNVVRSL
jgi:hypothetical protein